MSSREMSDAVRDAVRATVAGLESLHAEVLTRAARMSVAIEALRGIAEDIEWSIDFTELPLESGRRLPLEPGRRPSVRTLALALMEEEDRDWSTGEILDEYHRRGRPVHGTDPNNALRAALADAKKRGMVVSTGLGRYTAAKWVAPSGADDNTDHGADSAEAKGEAGEETA